MAAAAAAAHTASDLIDGTTVAQVPPAPVVSSPVQAPEDDAVELTQVQVAPHLAADLEDTIIPELADEPSTDDVPTAMPTASADPFVAATKLFETTPIAPTPAAEAAPEIPVAAEPLVDADGLPAYLGSTPRRSRTNFQRIATAGSSIGVMALVGAFAISMALPGAPASNVPQAVDLGAVSGTTTSDTDVPIQAFVASGDVQNPDIQRSQNYAAASAAQMAGDFGILNYSSSLFSNNQTAAIQWPFAVGTTMSYGYGMRDGRLHEGIDFTPGDGAEVQAIADGTVRIATEDGGAYGVTVYVDHVIDGQVITSHYAHMQYGSLRVKEGDVVKPGTVVGLTGNTGRSFGAHMHFELIVNGSTIDPLPWLAEHAGGYNGG